MKIGVISDTHGHREPTERALRLLDSSGVGLVIHCGDVGTEVVRLFAGRPVHLVAGNTDDTATLRRAVEEANMEKELEDRPGPTFHDPPGVLEIEGRRIAFLHGDDGRLLRELIESGDWDVVCHGHTHVYANSRRARTLVLNPGALWRTRHPSLAVLEIPSLEVRRVPL